jgi:hypothetical protein
LKETTMSDRYGLDAAVMAARAGDLEPAGECLARISGNWSLRDQLLARLEAAGIGRNAAWAAARDYKAAEQARQQARLDRGLAAAIADADWDRVDRWHRAGARFGWEQWHALPPAGRAALRRRDWARRSISHWAKDAQAAGVDADWARAILAADAKSSAKDRIGVAEGSSIRWTWWLKSTIDRWLARWAIVHRVGIDNRYDDDPVDEEWVPVDDGGEWREVYARRKWTVPQPGEWVPDDDGGEWREVYARRKWTVPQPGDLCEGGIVEAALLVRVRDRSTHVQTPEWRLGCRPHTEASRRRWAAEVALRSAREQASVYDSPYTVPDATIAEAEAALAAYPNKCRCIGSHI